jgi:hypothetical protein
LVSFELFIFISICRLYVTPCIASTDAEFMHFLVRTEDFSEKSASATFYIQDYRFPHLYCLESPVKKPSIDIVSGCSKEIL